MLDLTSVEAADYGGSPALKVPVLLDASQPDEPWLIGTENICVHLVRLSGKRASVVMRGDVQERVVLNAEELTLHVMQSEVALIMAKIAGDARLAPPKVSRSIENSLSHLDRTIDAALAALPEGRAFSWLEVSLFSLLRHLPFREVMGIDAYPRLVAFAGAFEARESARATGFRYDAA